MDKTTNTVLRPSTFPVPHRVLRCAGWGRSETAQHVIDHTPHTAFLFLSLLFSFITSPFFLFSPLFLFSLFLSLSSSHLFTHLSFIHSAGAPTPPERATPYPTSHSMPVVDAVSVTAFCFNFNFNFEFLYCEISMDKKM